MLDRRETKEDDLHPCIPQVTAIREVADASPPPSAWRSLSLYIPASFARNPQMRPAQGGARICRLAGSRVVELVGQAARPVEPKAVSAKVRAVHHVFLARCALNVVEVDS